MKKKIIIVVSFAVIVVTGVIVWGTTRPVRLDEVKLAADGLTLDLSHESIQFSGGDDLYRTWNDEEVIQSSDDKKSKDVLDRSSVLFYDNGNLMFTGEPALIRVDGTTNKLSEKEDYIKQGLEYHSSQESDSKISDKEIVKVQNRQYFVAASGVIKVDGEQKGTVENPLLFVDKSGSVTVFSQNQRTRYLGHFVMEIDEEHILDLSQEIYYVKESEIDLAKYGGSDNEKLVVLEEEEAEADKEDEKEKDEKEKGQNNNSAEDQSNGTGGGSGSDNNQSDPKAKFDEIRQSIKNLPSQAEIDKINEQIDDLNSKYTTKAIPKVDVIAVGAQTTAIEARVHTTDVDNTLVGQVTYELFDHNNTLINTQILNKADSKLLFDNLLPNKEYSLRITYEFDLGDGAGKTKISSTYNSTIKTLSVKALYFETIGSTTLDVDVQLDASLSNISEAELKVFSGSSEVQSVFVDPLTLNGRGMNASFKNLNPDTVYGMSLVLRLNNGEEIILNEKTFKTNKEVSMRNFVAGMKYAQVIQANFEFEAPEYTVDNIEVIVSKKNLFFWENVDIEVLEVSENSVDFIPLVEESNKNLRVSLRISVTQKETKESKVFDYTAENTVAYENLDTLLVSHAENVENELEGNTLEFVFTSGVLQNDYHIVFEKEVEDEWVVISEHNVFFEHEEVMSKSFDNGGKTSDKYRVVVYQNDMPIEYVY